MFDKVLQIRSSSKILVTCKWVWRKKISAALFNFCKVAGFYEFPKNYFLEYFWPANSVESILHYINCANVSLQNRNHLKQLFSITIREPFASMIESAFMYKLLPFYLSVNSLTINDPLTYKPVNWFALQINWLEGLNKILILSCAD